MLKVKQHNCFLFSVRRVHGGAGGGGGAVWIKSKYSCVSERLYVALLLLGMETFGSEPMLEMELMC